MKTTLSSEHQSGNAPVRINCPNRFAFHNKIGYIVGWPENTNGVGVHPIVEVPGVGQVHVRLKDVVEATEDNYFPATSVFGGPQENAGRPELPDDEKKPRIVVFPSPENYGRLIDAVGNGRGAVSREIDRILTLYFERTEIV